MQIAITSSSATLTVIPSNDTQGCSIVVNGNCAASLSLGMCLTSGMDKSWHYITETGFKFSGQFIADKLEVQLLRTDVSTQPLVTDITEVCR
jgi:hypothetical protein